jgi:ABC-type lipoprotein export system ATPase subunit
VTQGRRRLETGLAVQCDRLRHVYVLDDEEIVALDDVELHVRPGEGVALLGPSGSGKSTLLTLLAGLLRPTSGRLFIGADDMTLMSERELLTLRSQRIGVVVQGPSRNLLPYGTAEDNVLFAQRGVRGFRRAELPEPRELLDRLGLGELIGQVVGRMSGGEQQRLSVALAMANGPGLLLADEPTSQLDRPNRDKVVGMLRTVTERFGTTLVAVTHDADVAQALGRTVTIIEGRADDRAQSREQFVAVRGDGTVLLPADVLETLPPGSRARVVRKPDSVELVRDEPHHSEPHHSEPHHSEPHHSEPHHNGPSASESSADDHGAGAS